VCPHYGHWISTRGVNRRSVDKGLAVRGRRHVGTGQYGPLTMLSSISGVSIPAGVALKLRSSAVTFQSKLDHNISVRVSRIGAGR
jgi:hypothetical protein